MEIFVTHLTTCGRFLDSDRGQEQRKRLDEAGRDLWKTVSTDPRSALLPLAKAHLVAYLKGTKGEDDDTNSTEIRFFIR